MLNLPKEIKNKFCLSFQTIEGIRITDKLHLNNWQIWLLCDIDSYPIIVQNVSQVFKKKVKVSQHLRIIFNSNCIILLLVFDFFEVNLIMSFSLSWRLADFFCYFWQQNHFLRLLESITLRNCLSFAFILHHVFEITGNSEQKNILQTSGKLIHICCSGLFLFWTIRSEGRSLRDSLINVATCLFAYHWNRY